jgi:hypothetical protein
MKRMDMLRYFGWARCPICCRMLPMCGEHAYQGMGLPFDHDDPVCDHCCGVHALETFETFEELVKNHATS